MKPKIRSNYMIKLCALFLLTGFLHPVYGQRISLTLDSAVEYAMEKSPNVQRTKLDLERRRELLKAQQAATKSNFRLTLNPFAYESDLSFNTPISAWISNETKESYGTFTISQPIQMTGGTLSLNNRLYWQDSYSDYQGVRNKQFSNRLYLNFNQPLFTYNQLTTEIKELELSLERTQLTYAIQKLEIERLVAQTFYTTYQNKLKLDIAREELKNQEISYDIIKKKVEADITAREELYQAEVSLLTAKSSVQNAILALEDSYDDLKQYIGLPLGEDISVEADTSVTIADINLEKAISSGIQNRKELRQNKIDIETALIDLVRTSSQNEFKGALNLTYGLTGTDPQFASIYEKTTESRSLGFTLEIPLWDWGEKKSRVKASNASIKSQQLTYDEEMKSINIEIRKTYRQLRNLELQIEIARQNVINAQLTYDINLERYNYGDLTSMDLSIIQQQLSGKKNDLVTAIVNYKLALLNLKIQSLWDFENNEPVLH